MGTISPPSRIKCMLFRRNAGRRVVLAKGAERGEDLFFHSASLSFCRPFMIKNVCNAIEDDVTILSATVYGIRTKRIFPGETRFSIAISINDASTRFPRRKNRRKAKRRKDRLHVLYSVLRERPVLVLQPLT